MRYYFAPLEGITGYIFRNAHSRHFPGVDKYFTPFISTNQEHRFNSRELRDVLPENNDGVTVVPQLLGKVADEFAHAARVLADMGYGEVNLNLGCPSKTVTAKGKGSGALADTEALDRFLGGIFEKTDIAVSIKTRLGISEPEEFETILGIFNRYPVAELTVHPRVQRDFYKNKVNLDAFGRAERESRSLVCYNGDLRSQADCGAIAYRYPRIGALMLGRGLVADPSLVTRIRGGMAAKGEQLREFHDEIYEGYRLAFNSERNAMMRMKELWSYMARQFEGSEKQLKQMKKATRPDEFAAIAAFIFSELEVKTDAGAQIAL